MSKTWCMVISDYQAFAKCYFGAFFRPREKIKTMIMQKGMLWRYREVGEEVLVDGRRLTGR